MEVFNRTTKQIDYLEEPYSPIIGELNEYSEMIEQNILRWNEEYSNYEIDGDDLEWWNYYYSKAQKVFSRLSELTEEQIDEVNQIYIENYTEFNDEPQNVEIAINKVLEGN